MSYVNVLMDNLVELSTLQEKYLARKITSGGFVCSTKKNILHNYFESAEDLMVLFGGFLQTLCYIDTMDEFEEKFKILKKSFRDNFFHSIRKDNTSSIKMVLLFNMILSQIEDLFFHDIKTSCIPYVGSKGDHSPLFRIITEEILDLLEIASLLLSGIRISCSNIKDEILKDSHFSKALMKVGIDYKDPSDICLDECPLFKNKDRECLHFFIVEEMFRMKKWLNYAYELFYKYHKNPEKLAIFVDYRLIRSLVWDQDNYDRYKYLEDHFGTVYVINAESVDFGQWINDVEVVPAQALDECILT